MFKNNCFTQSNHFRLSFLCLKLWFSLTITFIGFSTAAFGQVALPMWWLKPDAFKEEERINYTVAIREHLFVSKGKDLLIINPDQTIITVNEVKGDLIILKQIKDKAFISTSQGNWIVDVKGEATLFNSVRENIYEVEVVNEHLFVVTENGLFISGQDKTPIHVSDVKGDFRGFEVIGNKALVATFQGAWVVDSEGAATLVTGTAGSINGAVAVNNSFFVETDKGLFIVNLNGTATQVENIKRLRGIIKIQDKVFINTPQGALLVDINGKITPITGIDALIGDVEPVNDHLFVGTEKGLLVVNADGTATPVDTVKCAVGYSKFERNQLFVQTNCYGIIIFDSEGREISRILNPLPTEIYDINAVGNYIYIHSGFGLARIDPKVSIKTKLIQNSRWATIIGYVLPPHWLPAEKTQVEAYYSDENGKDPYDKNVLKEFLLAKPGGEVTPFKAKFSTQEDFRYDLDLGRNEAHYWVRDFWGNTFEQKAVYYGLPSQYFILILPFILSALFVLGCFALAPKIHFCHSAIMNPLLRRFFSLGSVPLLLSVFSSLRRYTLRRYSDSINKDKEFSEWKDRFIFPDEDFYPEHFGKKLNSERKLLLTGQSGFGKTSFFKYLTAVYASPDKPLLPAKVFPVYISLTNYGVNSLEELISNQLYAYGEITDEALAPMFWKRGGLLIFLDGVNEVKNSDDRGKLSEFVQKYWTTNYICLSSQQVYREIKDIPEVELKTFSPEKVCEFIRQRVNDKEKAGKIIGSLSNEDYQLYSTPRDLEFAVEILNGGKDSLPKSRTELYKMVFSSLFTRWKENGNMDAKDILCKRAYEMISGGDRFFDLVDNPKFKEITIDLYKQKFLMQREENYNFRHDLTYSYLASEYFYPRWQGLFKDLNGKQIDNNWLEMLKFSCENIEDSDQIKNLVYEVLERSLLRDMVKSLFKWLKANYPGKCASWKKDFSTKYGELELD